MRKPNRALEGVKPIDLLVSETGAYKVQEVLGRIQFGIYS
ncbi:MAG: MbcA/ParS/Xre antitoxin family protein [Pseudomonadota bacterium]